MQLYLGLRALIENTAAQFGAATIVSTSSASHYDSYAYGVATSIADLNDEANYSPLLAYGQSKLAQVVFTQELARRMTAEGKNVFVNVYHPGVVATNILEPLLDSLRQVAFLPTAVIEVWAGNDEVSNSINNFQSLQQIIRFRNTEQSD